MSNNDDRTLWEMVKVLGWITLILLFLLFLWASAIAIAIRLAFYIIGAPLP